MREIETVFNSEALLICNPAITAEKKLLLERLIFRINALLTAKRYKYIMLNIPNDRLQQISHLLPGMKSPTVMPLALEGWSSLHSVVEENTFWDQIENLRAAGAEGILVIPIEKMVN